MSQEVIINFPAPNTTSVAPLQTPGVAGNLILVSYLNAANLPPLTAAPTFPFPPNISFPAALRYPPVVFPGVQLIISITSAMNASLGTYTLIGEDIRGNVISENLGGPNIGTTTSANLYHKLYAVYVNNAGVGITVSVGYTNATTNANVSTSMWVNGDHFRPYAQTSIRATITGSITYSIKQTLDDPLQIKTPDIFSINGALDAPTTSEFFYLTSPWGGIQASVSSVTAGSVRIGILQQGVKA